MGLGNTGYETQALAKDMVMMVYPTAHDPDIGGARLQFMFHVTSSGCETLTGMSDRIPIASSPGLPGTGFWWPIRIAIALPSLRATAKAGR